MSIIGKLAMSELEAGWIMRIRNARNWKSWPGTPIYSYRITADEYHSLCNILATRCKSEPIKDLLQEPGFVSMFVIYAAEWWKREYSGGAWNWANIVGKISDKDKDVSRTVLADGVTRGLKILGVPVDTDTDGKIYFGAIVANGGLPANYMVVSTVESSFVRMIRACLSDAIKFVMGPAALMANIQSRAISMNIPDSLRNTQVYELIMSVIQVIVSLKERYKLESPDKAIEILDNETGATWRDDFPILLEDDAVIELFKSFIKTAASNKALARRPYVLRVLQDGKMVLRFMFPDKPTDGDFFIEYFNVTGGAGLPRKFFINTWGDNPLCVAKVVSNIIGDSRYHIVGVANNNYDVSDAVALTLYSPDGGNFGVPMRLAESINLSAPLIFIRDSESNYIYQTYGSVDLKESECFIGVIQDSDLNKELRSLSHVETFDIGDTTYNLYKCDSDILFGEYQVCLNRPDSTAYQYVLGGRLFGSGCGIRSSQYEVYVGLPSLSYLDPEGNMMLCPRPVYRRHNTDEDLKPFECVGLIDVCHVQDGKTKCRLPAFVLPDDANVQLTSMDMNRALISFNNIGEIDTVPRASNLYECDVVNRTQITVCATTKQTPDSVGFKLSDGANGVNIRVPFPVSGAAFFDSQQNCINGQSLSLHRAANGGVRIKIFAKGTQRNDFSVKISVGLHEFNYALHLPGDYIELSLADYLRDISYLFVAHNASRVRVSVRGGANEQYVDVYPYDYTLQSDGTLHGKTKSTTTDATVFCAANVLLPSVVPMRLPVSDGHVDFSVLDNSPGAYLIYSAPESDVSLLPTLWSNLPTETSVTSLATLLPGNNYDSIMAHLSKDMCDLSHSDWELVSNLADLFLHYQIPMHGFMLWDCVSYDSRSLASFLFRLKIQNYKAFFVKLRDSLFVNVALVSRAVLRDTVARYLAYIGQTPDLIHLLALRYDAIADTFQEIEFILATEMFSPLQAFDIITNQAYQSLPYFTRLQSNLRVWSNATNSPKAAQAQYMGQLFGDSSNRVIRPGHYDDDMPESDTVKKAPPLVYMLNSHFDSSATASYAGINAPFERLISRCSDRCYQECTCYTDSCLFSDYDQRCKLSPRDASIIHFPMFCAALAFCDNGDGFLSDSEIKNAVCAYMRWDRFYFIQAYRITTIIMVSTMGQ